jgi:hypothetical protein
LINILYAGTVAQMREMKNAYKILVREYEGEGSLGRPSHAWNITLT